MDEIFKKRAGAGRSAFYVLLATTAMMSSMGEVARAADTDESVQEVVVTGSRIKSPDAASAQPLTVISADLIASEKASNIEDILKKDPSIDFSGGISANSNNGGVGASEVGLRNLGPARTLVLVNSYRFPYTDTQGAVNAVDFNSIPVAMVDHIDILRDGASSIYGADAIGGVINVVTKKNFDGVEVHGSVGETDKDDGLTWNVGSLLGVNFPGGNVMVDVETDRRDPISQGNRYWSSNAKFTGTDGECADCSSKLPYLTGKIGGTGPTYAWINGALPTGQLTTVSAFPSALGNNPLDYYSPQNGRYFFDLSQEPDLIGGLDRKQISFLGHYDILPNVTALLEGFYTDRQSTEALNPQPLSATITTHKYPGLLIPYLLPDGSVNPYNPYGADITGANFRPFGGGLRQYSDEVQTYRMRAEVSGTFLDDYSWDAGYVVGKSSATYNVAGSINFTHLGQETGQFACGQDVASGCHLANFFAPLTPADIAYLTYTNTRTSEVEEDFFYANVTGPVVELPYGMLNMSVGVEQRNESGYDRPSSVIVNGDGDSDAAPSQGAYQVTSTYVEANIPIVKDLPFVKLLTADASGRYDYYSSFGRATTYKVGVDWAVTDDIRFRGSQGTGVRAPQVKELFGGQYQNFPSYNGDPCDTAGGIYVGSATCNAALRKVGLNPATYVSQLDQVPGAQVPTINGGNPALKPEAAQQFSLGTVITPSFIKNLALTVDYYNIHIRNAIGSFDPNSIIAQCYGPQQLQSACSLITRSTLTGDVSSVYAPNVNFGYENTDGIDIGLTYNFPVSDLFESEYLPGRVILAGSAQYLLHDTTTNPDGTPYPHAGLFSLGTGTFEPRWKATVNLGYTDDMWTFDWRVRYLGGAQNDAGGGDYLGNQVGGTVYNDLSIGFHYENLKLTVGMDNVFDRDPPVVFGDVSSTNALSLGSFDFTGRFVYLKASILFHLPEAPTAAVAAPLPPPPPPAPTPVAAAAPSELKIRNYQVFFDFDKFDITSAAKRVIADAAAAVKSGNIARIDVIGHTDTVGSASYNLELSVKRAEAVKAELEADGVHGPEIVASGAGKTGLLVSTGDGVREPQNRRAEIHLE